MKLFLSSYGVSNFPERLLDLLGSKTRAALLMNAADAFGDGRRSSYVKRYCEEFDELGIPMEDLDLRDYFGKPDALAARIEDYGLLWASGGNTFVLRAAMKKSGLDRLLPKYLASDDNVFGGFSAGACVLGPTLKGIHLADDPSEVPAKELVWQGLGLIDFCIVPHYNSEHSESPLIDKVISYYQGNSIKHELLRDGEAIVINGACREILR